jgi:filamentous hemagglutinin family protein
MMNTSGIGWCATIFVLASLSASGQVKTDGTVGARQSFSGTSITLPHTLGQTRGSNLFHSFEEFSVPAGGSVTFTGPTSVHNVLARVTGSSPSQIDGALRCDIPNANLFLMNPAGVIFGAGATLDVQGSFVVTTADSIHLADGGHFAATTAAGDTVLSAAQPVAFGFLAPRPASITVNGAILAAPANKVMAVVGGDIGVHGGHVTVDDGRLVVTGAGSAGTVELDADTPDTAVTLKDFTDRAAVTIDGQAQLSTGGGGMLIRGGDVVFDAALRDQNASTHAGRGIDIDATRTLQFTGGLTALTIGDALSSPISLTAPDLTLNGASIDALSEQDTAGGTGTIQLLADRLTLTGNSRIFSTLAGSGAAGEVSLTGRQSITLDQNSSVSTDTGGLATGTKGGDIRVQTSGTLNVLDTSELTAGSFGSAAAGHISIDAGDVIVDGQGQGLGSSIQSDTLNAGRGGDVTIRCDSLTLRAGGNISAFNQGGNVGGSINVVAAKNILIDGTDQGGARTGLFADSQPGAIGDAAAIYVQADQLTLRNTGELSASAFGLGRGGDITVRARLVSIEGAANADDPSLPPTGIISVNLPDPGGPDLSVGAAGNIHVKATGSLAMTSGNATISSDAFGDAPAGAVTIDAGRVVLRDHASVESTTIGAIGGRGDAGQVNVFATELDMTDSTVGAITTGAGKGGNVTILARRIALHGSSAITSSTGVPDDFDPNFSLIPDTFGAGGDVSVTARQSLTIDGTAAIAAATQIKDQLSAGGRGGSVTVEAYDLTIGESGRITVATDNAAAGGSILAHVSNQLLIGGHDAGFDATTSSALGGAGGNVSIQAHDLRVQSGGGITASTSGAGDAGRIDIVADAIRITDGSVSALTTGPGRGGNVTIQADTLNLDGAASINASTGISTSSGPGSPPSSLGAAGDVNVTARSVLLADTADIASATRTGGALVAGGKGGDIGIDTADLSITGSARITVATDNAANGGSIRVDAANVATIDGLGAGIDATTSHPGSKGQAGDISLHAGMIQITHRGDITAATTGTGDAGHIELVAGALTLDRGGAVRSSSTGSGNGSSVGIRVTGDALISDDASVTVASTSTAGGDLHLEARSIRVNNARLSAEAGMDGGNIKLTAQTLVRIEHSTITAQAGGDGGLISIDPVFVVLQQSTINGLSGGTPVEVNIRADQFIKSADSRILTENLSIPPQTDVAGTLVTLPASLFAADLKLRDLCPRIFGQESSSFLVVGRNATPPAPGGLAPSLDLPERTDSKSANTVRP